MRPCSRDKSWSSKIIYSLIIFLLIDWAFCILSFFIKNVIGYYTDSNELFLFDKRKKKIQYWHFNYLSSKGDRNMIYAVRKEWESNEKLILRYKKMFFQSRIVTKLKKERYAIKDLSKRKRREKAIVTNHYRELNSKVYF